MNKQRILLMYAGEYDMKTEDGRVMKGCTLKYFFFGNNGELLSVHRDQVGGVGYQNAKSNASYDIRDQVIAAPAVYDAEFDMRVGGDGKPVLLVTALHYVSDAIFSMVEKK